MVRCPAKINLFLDVVRRRPDGYHDIDTVMQAIDLFDELEIEPRRDGALTLACSDPTLPTDERNLVVRAAAALREATGCRAGARMRLTKRIPTQAGLGGGSSDAAGALVGLNAAWGLGLPADQLRDVAAGVGSDVPFFLLGGTARCTGRGEQVEPVAGAAQCHYVLVCPHVKVSTAAAYRKLRFPLTPTGLDASMCVYNLVEGNVETVGRCLYNRLEDPAFSIHPMLSDAKSGLAECGVFAGVCMTGSGSALFGLCRPQEAKGACERAAGLGLGRARRVRGIASGVVVHSRR